MIIFAHNDHKRSCPFFMNQEQRKKVIIKSLESNEEISIHEIVMRCQVSEITARRDLALLEKKGVLKRTHGGAVRSTALRELFGWDSNLKQNKERKVEISKLASTLVDEGDTIYMDCGTTVYHLAQFLHRFKQLRVITNSLPVVSDLMPYPHIHVYLIGGELDNTRKALYGPPTQELLSRHKADKAFIGARGVSLSAGLSCHSEKEASITLRMAEYADKVYLLCDSSKIEKQSYYNYSPVSLIDYLVTDKKIDPSLLEMYRREGIRVITPEPAPATYG